MKKLLVIGMVVVVIGMMAVGCMSPTASGRTFGRKSMDTSAPPAPQPAQAAQF